MAIITAAASGGKNVVKREFLNSKHEIRNKHECLKYKCSKQKIFGHSNFGFVSDFKLNPKQKKHSIY